MAAPPPTMAPSQSLFITNLPDKRMSQADLRRSLYALFMTCGLVVDLNSKKRGCAHVGFRDVATATKAMRDMQGVDFFGNEMKAIQYAKGKSVRIQKLAGTYKAPEPTPKATTNVTGTATAATTELQRSIFQGPPRSEPKLPTKPQMSTETLQLPQVDNAASPGTPKRKREEDSEESEESEESKRAKSVGTEEPEEDDEGEAMVLEDSDSE